MQITTKYDLKQKLWLVLAHYHDVPCPACKGTGKLPGADGQPYDCGNCDGSGNVEKETAQVHPVTVDFLEATVGLNTGRTKYGIAEQTIGVFDECEFFATEADAQAEADARNAGGD